MSLRKSIRKATKAVISVSNPISIAATTAKALGIKATVTDKVNALTPLSALQIENTKLRKEVVGTYAVAGVIATGGALSGAFAPAATAAEVSAGIAPGGLLMGEGLTGTEAVATGSTNAGFFASLAGKVGAAASSALLNAGKSVVTQQALSKSGLLKAKAHTPAASPTGQAATQHLTGTAASAPRRTFTQWLDDNFPSSHLLQKTIKGG